MLSLKCDHTFLCEFPILFSTVKLKLGHGYNFQIQSKIQNLDFEILKSFSQFIKERQNLDFRKA